MSAHRLTDRVVAILVAHVGTAQDLERAIRLFRLILDSALAADRCEHHPRARAKGGAWCSSCGAMLLGSEPTRFTRSTTSIIISGALEELRKLARADPRRLLRSALEPRCERCNHQRTGHAGDSGPCDASMCSCLEFQGT